jgi:hypothetical protein
MDPRRANPEASAAVAKRRGPCEDDLEVGSPTTRYKEWIMHRDINQCWHTYGARGGVLSSHLNKALPHIYKRNRHAALLKNAPKLQNTQIRQGVSRTHRKDASISPRGAPVV